MLACLFAIVVFNVGKPEQEGMVTTTIGWVAPDSNAAKGGLKPVTRSSKSTVAR